MANDIIIKKFWTTYEPRQLRKARPDPFTPGEKIGEEEIMEEDWVEYIPRLSPLNTSTVERVRHLKPESLNIKPGSDGGEKMAFFRYRWAQIEPSYEQWKNGQTMPMDGTPLAAWPGVTADMARVFQLAGIRTVEEVRDMDDGTRRRVNLPNLMQLQKTAGLYLESTDTAKKDAQIASLQEQMDAMKELLAEAISAKASDSDDEVAKLRFELTERNVEFDKRWGAAKLREALNASQAA